MVKCLKIFVAIAVLVTSLHTTAWAQKGESTATSGPRRQIATIVFAGLAGAVLGLSTLSFYGRPQDRLSNIAVGFAVGVIAGAAYTTYQTATNPDALTESTTSGWMQQKALSERFHLPGLSFSYGWDF